jgi:hypothetical protein
MSRTYRCRHLPKHAITGWGGRWAANKIIDGGGGWRRWYERIENETIALVGPKPPWGEKLVKGGSHVVYVPTAEKPKWWSVKLHGFWSPPTKRVELPGVWRKTEATFQWNRAHSIVENNLVRNVATWHPHAKGRHRGRGKMGQYRRRANREMRRRNRQVAHDVVRSEECDGDWAQRDLYLDRWAFC